MDSWQQGERLRAFGSLRGRSSAIAIKEVEMAGRDWLREVRGNLILVLKRDFHALSIFFGGIFLAIFSPVYICLYRIYTGIILQTTVRTVSYPGTGY